MDSLPKPAPAPAPEATSPRRIFSPDDKLRILREAQSCTEPGQLSALLRKEGIYSSSLSQWRRLHDALGWPDEPAQRLALTGWLQLLSAEIGCRRACAALNLPRATLYRPGLRCTQN